MSVLINHKICDNAKECLGIEVCPSGALYWDDSGEKIEFEEGNCTLCGACEAACEVGAIRVAASKKEYDRIKAEIDNDPRRVTDLFVDRYGAMPVHPAFQMKQGRFELEILGANKLTVLEVYKDDTIECLLNSIPIKELFRDMDLKYRKLRVEDNALAEKYDVKELPALLFFRDGGMVGKIEGFYGVQDKDKMIRKINGII